MSSSSSSPSNAPMHTLSSAERKYIQRFRNLSHAGDLYDSKLRAYRQAKTLLAAAEQAAAEHQHRVELAMAATVQAHKECSEALAIRGKALQRAQNAFNELPGDVVQYAREAGASSGRGE